MTNLEQQVPEIPNPRRNFPTDRENQNQNNYFMWEYAADDYRIRNYFSGNPHQAEAVYSVSQDFPVPHWPQFGHIINYNV